MYDILIKGIEKPEDCMFLDIMFDIFKNEVGYSVNGGQTWKKTIDVTIKESDEG